MSFLEPQLQAMPHPVVLIGAGGGSGDDGELVLDALSTAESATDVLRRAQQLADKTCPADKGLWSARL